jgi:iron complex outermembrane recepter protein
LGWRPTDNSEYTIRYSRTEYTDEDIALREYYRFDEAASGDFAYLDSTTNTFGVVDAALQKQYFIQDGTSTTENFDLSGENKLNGGWILDYKYATSTAELSKPDAARVQFRIRDLPMLGQAGKDYIKGQIISPAEMAQLAGTSISSSTTAGYFQLSEGRVQENMDYDNLFLEDSFRTDKVDQIAVNLKKEFDSGLLSYIKTGFLFKSRERNRDKDRWSVNPEQYADFCGTDTECKAYALNGTLGQFETYTPNHPDIEYDSITRGDAERLIASTKNTALLLDPDRVGIDSTKDDFVITEDAQEAYVMAEFQLTDRSSLITGVRYVNTDFESTGNFSIRNDRFEDFSDQKLDVAVPLADTKTSYDNVLPSVHYRLDLNDETLIRASVWTSYTRPDFDQARAFANITDRVSLCNPALLDSSDNVVCSDDLQNTLGANNPEDVQGYYMSNSTTLNIGNPNLIAMTSNNFDTSIAWYPSDDLYLQAALFYKDIDDFIVEVNGDSLALSELPIALPIDQITQFQIPTDVQFDSVNYTTNGNKAKVYGIELSYSQNFDMGFFVSSNATFINSSADVGADIRADKIQLPDQADQTINLTLGWANDDVELRFIANHRSSLLKQIGACNDVTSSTCKAWADIYQDASTTYDFKATYQVTKDVKVYFDALNLTADQDLYYYQGNAQSGGNVLFLSEDFGSSVQLGINVNFK